MDGTVEVSGNGADGAHGEGIPRPIGSGESMLRATPFTLPIVGLAAAATTLVTAYQLGGVNDRTVDVPVRIAVMNTFPKWSTLSTRTCPVLTS